MATNEQGVVSTAQSAELHSLFHSQKQGPFATPLLFAFLPFLLTGLLMALIRNTAVFRRGTIDINY